MNDNNHSDLPIKEIRAYCETQPIARLSEFATGFEYLLRPDTDIGFIVDYVDGEAVTLLDMAGQEIDLGDITGRRVCMFTSRGLANGLFQTRFRVGRKLYEKAI